MATSDVSVESVDGVVRVRGQVASEADIARVVRAINGVPGVQGVESLMHLPGEPAEQEARARRRRLSPPHERSSRRAITRYVSYGLCTVPPSSPLIVSMRASSSDARVEAARSR